MLQKKLRMAAIGLGWVALNRHIPTLVRNPNIELVGIISSDAKKVDFALKQLGPIQSAVCTDGLVDWLDKVDAVVIGTDPTSHYSLAKNMLLAGKHVLSEKPMAMNLSEGYDLVKLSIQEQRIYGIMHNFQFARCMLRLKKMISEGQIGDITGVWAIQLSNPRRRLPVWYETLPLGLFYDESPHLLYLIGSVVPNTPKFLDARIIKSTQGKQTPSSITAYFKSEEIPIQIMMHFEAPVSEWHLIVMGTKQLAIADIFRDILVTVHNDGSHLGRNILLSSFDLIRTHLWGTLTSGILLLQKNLPYGNDVVINRFQQAIEQKILPSNISAFDAIRILEFQHQIINSVK